MANPDIHWKGASGETYGYWIHSLGTPFKDDPGNYIYAQETQAGRWRAIYIGQTSNLNDRLTTHEKDACAKRNGATHIHAHTSSASEAVRLSEESDLIAEWSPVCNG